MTLPVGGMFLLPYSKLQSRYPLDSSLDDKQTDALLVSSLVLCILLQWSKGRPVASVALQQHVSQRAAGNYWEPLHYILYGTGVQNFE
eukprot:757658-Hanusia_phi.AAC.4